MPQYDEQAMQESWADLYRCVLRLRPVLEKPLAVGDAAAGLLVYADFCRWLRMYLLSAGQADEGTLVLQEIEAAVERENWHALWSNAGAVPTPPAPSDAR